MQNNLLDDDMKIRDIWLKEPINSTICRYLESWEYTLENLKEFNDDYEEIKATTDIADIFSSLMITELCFGIIIEDLTPGYYTLGYYSFNGNEDCSIM